MVFGDSYFRFFLQFFKNIFGFYLEVVIFVFLFFFLSLSLGIIIIFMFII